MSTQLVAFEHVLSACEGTVGDEGYQALFGWLPGNGKIFTSFADHPRQYFPYTDKAGNTIRTSAAGKYQATVATWDDFIRERGPHDFSPASQDEFAEWLITKCGAMPDVEAGRLQEAIDKCGGRWASLPSSNVPQPHRSYDFCVAVFKAAGGRIYTERDKHIAATPVPQEAPKMGAIALPLLQTLLPSILGLFSGRAQAQIAKATGASPDAAAGFMQSLMQKVGDVAGIPVTDRDSAIQAVGAITKSADPEKIQVLEDHSLDYLDKLAPLIDKIASHELAIRKQADDSADRAGQRGQADKVDIGPMLALWGLIIFAVALAAVGAVLGVQVYSSSDHKLDTGLIGLLTILVYAAARIAESAYRYRFGGSSDSTVVNTGTNVVNNASQSKGTAQ